MAKTKSPGAAGRPRFRKGDRVSFLFGTGSLTGTVVEDRGRLGVGGRRLYGIRFEMYPGDQSYVEIPEEELNAESATGEEGGQRQE